MPNLSPSRWRSYRDVDAARDPEMLSHQLDDIASTGAIAATKQRSLELLRLSPGARALDVGCGNGPELEFLARIVGSRGRVVGLDRSGALIAAARARGLTERGPIELVVGDAQALPFDDGQFDGCRIDRTLQHLDHPESALSEMVRVTRPGGRVVATESRWGLLAPALDTDVTEHVLQVMSASDECTNWLGLLLPIMFQMAGLSDVQLISEDAVLSDYEELARFTNLEWSAQEALRTGELTAEQVSAWSASLRELADRGEAQVRILIVHVVGTKPPADAAS